MNYSKTLILPIFILLINFAFADIMITPFDGTFALGFIGFIVLVFITLGLLLALKVYSMVSKHNTENTEKKIKKLFQLAIKILIGLIVLSMVLSFLFGFNFNFTKPAIRVSALDALSDAVKSANPSGEQIVQNFVLNKGTMVNQSDLFLATDLDASSFIFEQGAFDESEIQVGEGNYINYVGIEKKLTLSALVICKPTQQQIKDTIALNNSLFGTDFIFGNYINCPQDLICCVIIPMKAN